MVLMGQFLSKSDVRVMSGYLLIADKRRGVVKHQKWAKGYALNGIQITQFIPRPVVSPRARYLVCRLEVRRSFCR